MKTMILMLSLLASTAALAAPFGGRGEQAREGGERFSQRNDFRRGNDDGRRFEGRREERREDRREGRREDRREGRRECGRFHHGHR